MSSQNFFPNAVVLCKVNFDQEQIDLLVPTLLRGNALVDARRRGERGASEDGVPTQERGNK